MLDLRRLRLLRELKVRGTVRGAAVELGYTAGAVSQQLGVLERELGLTLFERVGRNLRLTAAGELLADHANRLLEDAEVAETEVASLAAGLPTGTVRIAAFQSAFLHLVAPAIDTLSQTHPGIRLEAIEAEIEQSATAVALQQIDVAVGDEYEGQPREIHRNLLRQPLMTETIRAVLPAAHPVAADQNVSMESLAEAPWATCQPGTGQHVMTLSTCRGAGGFEPDIRYHSDDFLILLQAVRVTGAVALLPSLALLGHSPGVVTRPIRQLPLTREVFVLSRFNQTEVVRAAIDALRQSVSKENHPGGAEPLK